jgi:hypothetical protein
MVTFFWLLAVVITLAFIVFLRHALLEYRQNERHMSRYKYEYREDFSVSLSRPRSETHYYRHDGTPCSRVLARQRQTD